MDFTNLNKQIRKNIKDHVGNNYRETVRVGDSELPGAGLFATHDIPIDRPFAIYLGDIITVEESENTDSDYMVSRGNGLVIDSNNQTSCFGRYANDIIVDERTNAHLHMHDNEMYLIAQRDIEAGEEIFVDYGNYWNEHERFLMLSDESKLSYRESGREDAREWVHQYYGLQADGTFRRKKRPIRH